MRLLIVNHVANAAESLRANRMRTTLTMLGVMIGIASITVILSLSGGATKIITDQVTEMGGNIAIVRPDNETQSSQIQGITSPLSTAYSTSSLTEQDAKDIASLSNVQAAAPLMVIDGDIHAGDTTPSNATIVATTPDLQSIAQFPISDGQFIDSQTNQNTAVIGAQLSVDLFGTGQSIGKTFRIRDQHFTVIGILKSIGRPINYNNVDFDHAAVINLESGKSFNQGVAQIQQIDIKASNTAKLPSVLKEVKSVLKTNHAGEEDTAVLSGSELSRPSGQFYYAIATTVAAVAGISLLVGGIGIMNIMLVSVAERTREIGIRKALGASNMQIVVQFLIESLAMSIGGGILGYLLGYLLGFVVSRSFLTFDPIFSWQIAAITIGVSVVIGTLFGLYPAIRAARKDPISALRQYH